MTYTIRSYDPDHGTILVEFSNSVSFNLSVPMDANGILLTGDPLSTFIAGFAPAPSKSDLIKNANAIMSLVVPTPTAPITWSDIRTKRNASLQSTDWTQIADAPLSIETKAAWVTYRQSLRNIPQAFSAPAAVVFPTSPTANSVG